MGEVEVKCQALEQQKYELELESAKKMGIIQEITMQRETLMQQSQELIRERSKLIKDKEVLAVENKKLQAVNNQEYSQILAKIQSLEEENDKIKAENSEIIKQNYLLEEEKDELETLNARLKKKVQAK